MDARSLVRMLLWLAALGGMVLVASRVLGHTAARASRATPL